MRCLGGIGRLGRGIGLGLRVLGLAGILNNGNVAVVTVDGVGDSLEPAVGKSDVVLAVGEGSLSGLLGAEVVAGVVVLDGILVGVGSISLQKRLCLNPKKSFSCVLNK